MSKYNITMKQKNDSDYNELYPESLDTQIKLSKDTTGFTGTNVSEVLMELNNKIGKSGGGGHLPLAAISKRSGNGSNSITIPTSFKADFLIYYADTGGLTEGVFMYSISKGIYSITLGNEQIHGSNLDISATSSQIKIAFNSVGEFTANRFNSGLAEYCVYIVGAS